MKPFVMCARPHRDIREGRFDLSVYAADLWSVFKGEGAEEYKNPQDFWNRTYITKGLGDLLDTVTKRLKGEGGDPVIQLQTPFGGGKTHSLIALYHKARDIKANVAVFVGTVFDPRDTRLWEEIERQLRGKVEFLKGDISPGRDKVLKLLSEHQPLLILMDELSEYAVKCAGVKVGQSNLGAQTLAFMHELLEAVSLLPQTALVMSLPSSSLEYYDENAERMAQQLQKIAGRVEKVLTPIGDEEVPSVITRRLFEHIDQACARENIEEFLDYLERENLLPEDRHTYREKFLRSYPFQPEVIEVLYHRWGSFPSFQRTRGILRLLALVVYSLKDSMRPFIRLSDFDLSNKDIREELLKHIDRTYESVIAEDITDQSARAKKVDLELGDSYRPYRFGTRCATAIFMYSFSAGPDRGAHVSELKLACSEPGVESSIIDTTLMHLEEKLFYLANSRNPYYFSSTPNLNRVLFAKLENIDPIKIKEKERSLLREALGGSQYFDIYLFPSDTKDIPDTDRLKLIVLENKEDAKDYIDYCGQKPRVYKNVLFFLCPYEPERVGFQRQLAEGIAWQEIEQNANLTLTEQDKRKVKEKVEDFKKGTKELLRRLYRLVLYAGKEKVEEIDLGMPVRGIERIDKEIYDRLRSENVIYEKLTPHYIVNQFLTTREYILTKPFLEVFYKTPGMPRLSSKDVLKNAISEGVREKLFGLGILSEDGPACKYFGTLAEPSFEEGEILIKKELCTEKEEKEEEIELIPQEEDKGEGQVNQPTGSSSYGSPSTTGLIDAEHGSRSIKEFRLRVKVPTWRLPDVARTLRLIPEKFEEVELRLEVIAHGGKATKQFLQDKIEEGLKQAGCDIEEWNCVEDA
ncbi:MAG: DUF499 domain-containing protein [Thermocrinis sp.]|nr:DUF499 domain-containing protein [Thermocrinis sp.]